MFLDGGTMRIVSMTMRDCMEAARQGAIPFLKRHGGKEGKRQAAVKRQIANVLLWHQPPCPLLVSLKPDSPF